MRCSGNGLKQSVLSGQIHQQVNFHNPRRAVIGRETTNSEGGTQVAAPVTWPLILEKTNRFPTSQTSGWQQVLKFEIGSKYFYSFAPWAAVNSLCWKFGYEIVFGFPYLEHMKVRYEIGSKYLYFLRFCWCEHLVWAPSKFGHPSGSCGEDPIWTIDLLLFFVVVDNYLPTNQPTYLPTYRHTNLPT